MRALALTAAVVLAAAGCTSQAAIVDPPSTPSPPPPVTVLSLQQAKRALLTTRELPDWIGGMATDVTNEKTSSGKFDPPECSVLHHAQDDLGKPAVAVATAFTSGSDGHRIEEKVASWSAPQTALVQKLADAVPRCATYKITAADGTETNFVAKPLPVEGVADGLAVRLDGTSDSASFVMYYAHFVRGGTVLRLYAFGEQLTDADLTQAVAKAVERLEAATG